MINRQYQNKIKKAQSPARGPQRSLNQGSVSGQHDTQPAKTRIQKAPITQIPSSARLHVKKE